MEVSQHSKIIRILDLKGVDWISTLHHYYLERLYKLYALQFTHL